MPLIVSPDGRGRFPRCPLRYSWYTELRSLSRAVIYSDFNRRNHRKRPASWGQTRKSTEFADLLKGGQPRSKVLENFARSKNAARELSGGGFQKMILFFFFQRRLRYVSMVSADFLLFQMGFKNDTLLHSLYTLYTLQKISSKKVKAL